jgi:hypothetical protein
MDKENKQKANQKNDNLPMVESIEAEPTEVLLERVKDEAIELSGGKLDLKKGGNIVIGTLNVMARPLTHHLKNRHEKFYRESKFHLIADIFFVLLILGLAFTLIYFLSFQSKAQIDFTNTVVSGGVASGQSETFIIQYKNNGKVDIKDATLSLVFPKDFILQTVSPQNIWVDQTNTFSLGDLPRGANGKVKITGVTVGEVGSQQEIIYSLGYLQNGRSANTLGRYQFALESSVLTVSFDAPKQIYQNLDFAGTINLKNTGLADLNNEIDLAFSGGGITINSISADQANLVNGVVIVNGLKAGKNLAISYEAVANAVEGVLPAELEADLNLSGQKIKQVAVDRNLNIVVPKIDVTITSDKSVIASDDTVNFKLVYTNKEDAAIGSTSLTIMSADSGAVIKNITVTKNADKYKITGNSIVLGDLSAGQSGEIDFSVQLARQAISVNQLTGIIADIGYQINGRTMEYQMFSPKLKFISNLQLGSKALYYSAQGDQLGVGPLPPVVDVPTNYWVFWNIDNSGNELANLTVTADLPGNVGWTNQTTVLSGDIRYGVVSHKVVWTIDNVAAEGSNNRVGFEIELIPTVSELGKTPDLLSNIQYTATDTFTGQQISGSLPNITADLKDDPTASGKGKVIQLNNIVK